MEILFINRSFQMRLPFPKRKHILFPWQPFDRSIFLSSTSYKKGNAQNYRIIANRFFRGVAVFKMDKPLNQDDFTAMESQLKVSVEQDRRYWKVNDVKCDAINTAKTYEEFADRVAAAHLNPLHNSDFKKKCARKWNQYATDEKKSDE